jgi:dihydrofolate reductase
MTCTTCFLGTPLPAPSLPASNFVTESIGAFVKRLRKKAGKNIWMMGGGEIIASFLERLVRIKGVLRTESTEDP